MYVFFFYKGHTIKFKRFDFFLPDVAYFETCPRYHVTRGVRETQMPPKQQFFKKKYDLDILTLTLVTKKTSYHKKFSCEI